MDHNPQGPGRRHFHRGRRGPDRRGPDRRGPLPQAQEQPNRGDVDVEQIMRDIRARIAQRQGIELTNQQIQELAARRLESILDPRGVSPALLDQLRRATGAPADSAPAAPAEPPYTFEDTTLYDSHRGLMRFIRKLLNPILKLFFNPNPLIRALNTQARLNAEAAARDAERDRRQAEWNALHYELLQRVVTEISRVSLDAQALSLKVESLAAKVDFNERRVRGIEGTVHVARPAQRREPVEAAAAPAAAAASGETVVTETAVPGAPVEGTRRRRRRRRGRRGGGAPGDMVPGTAESAALDVEGDGGEQDEGPDEDEPGTAQAEPDAVVIAEELAATEPPVAAAPDVVAADPGVPDPLLEERVVDDLIADEPIPPPDGPERPDDER